MSEIHNILKKYWGFSSFREKQEDIVNSILEGNDTLALLPTGGGKSICFQVPAMCKPGICLVVSPLIALMKDQVDALTRKGIKAFRISSDLSYREIDLILDNCIYGEVKFLYVSPERLKTEIFLERFKKMQVNLIAVDEAHCISQWGYDFRPAYLEISKIKDIHPNIPIAAFTATATQRVVSDIQDKLEFKKPNVFKSSFERPNLIYVVRECENKYEKLLEICDKVVGTGIIYVSSRKRTKEISEFLNQRHISADFYHAGLEPKVKNKKQENWLKNHVRIIVSTNAFGMGIDKADVRFVVHMDLPSDPESYFQEAGRAGRDGKRSFAVVIHNQQDIIDLEERFQSNYPDLTTIKKVYRALSNHLQIPIGTGKNSVRDFFIGDFCNKYNFLYKEAFSALRILELSGAVGLNEAYHNPARVMVLLNRKGLYSFQMSHHKLNDLIQLLLRSYEGVFDMFVKIDEDNMAKRMNLNKIELSKQLLSLASKGVIHYIPQNNNPKVIFIEDRVNENQLIIDKSIYRERKAVDQERLMAMLNYLNSDMCRSLFLRKYFDPNEEGDCGHCDRCLAKKNDKEKANIKENIESEILTLLKEENLSAEVLMKSLKTSVEEDVLEVIRWLIDNKTIEYDNNQNLKLSND